MIMDVVGLESRELALSSLAVVNVESASFDFFSFVLICMIKLYMCIACMYAQLVSKDLWCEI